MCMNCGCEQPYEKHGNKANLDANDLSRAADANGQTLRETARNISRTTELLMAAMPRTEEPTAVRQSPTAVRPS